MSVEIISSSKNPLVKQLRQLFRSSKARHEANLAVAEGDHLVEALLDSELEVVKLIWAESAKGSLELVDLDKRIERQQLSSAIVKDSLFESISRIHAASGVIALLRPPASKFDLPAEDCSFVILEGVQDPGNLGTILRTVTAAGLGDVYLDTDSASAWSPKALRAGMGAQFGLKIHEQVDLKQLIENVKQDVLATDLLARQTIYQANLNQPVGWLFGSEGQGVSSGLLDLVKKRVLIPQAEASVESLNVAAAVAICLFEQRRQLQGQN